VSLNETRDRFFSGELSKPEFIERAHSEYLRLENFVERTTNTDVSEILITSEGVCFRFRNPGFVLWAPLDEPRVAPIEALNFGGYEKDIIWIYSFLLESITEIWDIGANIGWYSMWFASRSESIRVKAFEPVPKNYSFLCKNVAANSVGKRIQIHNYGMSNALSVAEVFIYPKGGTNASLTNVSGSAEVESVRVFMHTIDSWCDSFDEFPDLIKVDIEGAELLALKGGEHVLSTHRPVVVAEMLRKWFKPFGYHPNDAIEYMHSKGYSCFGITDNAIRKTTVVTDETQETNYVFLHREKHLTQIQEIERFSQKNDS